jgi:hypothetical protein
MTSLRGIVCVGGVALLVCAWLVLAPAGAGAGIDGAGAGDAVGADWPAEVTAAHAAESLLAVHEPDAADAPARTTAASDDGRMTGNG